MASFTLQFRVREKEDLSPTKKKVVLTATRTDENGLMTANQAHFGDGEASRNKLELFMDTATEKNVCVLGSDVLVQFTST